MIAKPYKIPFPFRKLKKDLIDTICTDIREGSTFRFAAEANGITKRILDMWIEQGQIDIEFELDTLPANVVLSLAKIKQTEIKKCRQAIRESEKGHKGAEWTLEHAYWREFGSNAQVMELSEEIEKLKQKKGDSENDGETEKVYQESN